MNKSINRTVQDHILKNGLEEKNVVLAVSGGPDSMAMLSSFHHAGLRNFIVVTIDHGIREESAKECAMVAEYCMGLGVTCYSVAVSGPFFPNTMARAREKRYEAIAEVAESHFESRVFYIATAHHVMDVAETLFIQIFRGTETLNVLPECTSPNLETGEYGLLRPLRTLHKEDLIDYCAKYDVPYVNDPSNNNRDYTRVWVRNVLLPEIKRKFPRAVERIAALTELQTNKDSLAGIPLEVKRQVSAALRGTQKKIDITHNGVTIRKGVEQHTPTPKRGMFNPQVVQPKCPVMWTVGSAPDDSTGTWDVTPMLTGESSNCCCGKCKKKGNKNNVK